MTAMAPTLRAERTQPRTGTVTPEDSEVSIARTIRGALEGYLGGRRLVKIKIRQVEGRNVHGFLKIEGGRGERLLVDFKAVTTQEGSLSSLEVGGRKISLDLSTAAKRTR
jgi:hypothetical protein